MRIESIHIQNYKVFKNVTVKKLSKMGVFLGPNGSGKTTFFDVFGFLSDALQHNVTIALNRRGGFSEVISRDSKPHDAIKFEIKFRNPQPDTSYAPLVTYSLEIGFEHGKAFINRELLKYRRGRKTGQPWHFLDFERGEGTAIINEEEYEKEGVEVKREFQKVSSPDILAIKGLGQFQKFKIISSFRSMLERWYVSNFNGVRIEELFFLIKEKGYTTIKSASDDQMIRELAKENQLGWLWRNHYIRGANLKYSYVSD